MKASEIFQSLPMGRLLEGVDRTLTNEVLKAYIHDFIYMVHHVQSEAECNVRILAFDGSTLFDIKGNFAKKIFFYMFFLMYKYGCLYVY